MKATSRSSAVSSELEAVFSECRDHIHTAVREYQADIDSAIEQLKDDLNRESKPSR